MLGSFLSRAEICLKINKKDVMKTAVLLEKTRTFPGYNTESFTHKALLNTAPSLMFMSAHRIISRFDIIFYSQCCCSKHVSCINMNI